MVRECGSASQLPAEMRGGERGREEEERGITISQPNYALFTVRCGAAAEGVDRSNGGPAVARSWVRRTSERELGDAEVPNSKNAKTQNCLAGAGGTKSFESDPRQSSTFETSWGAIQNHR